MLPAISEDEIERGGAGSGEEGSLGAPLAPHTAVPELVEELRRMATLGGAGGASEAAAGPLVGPAPAAPADAAAPVDAAGARAAPLD